MGMMENILGGAALAFGVGICGYSIANSNKTAKKLDISMKQLEQSGADRISQAIVDAAVKKAAEQKAESIAYDIHTDAKRSIKDKVNSAVNEVVTARTEEIRKAVDAKLTADDIQIDKEKLSKDVYANALTRISTDLYNDIRSKMRSVVSTSIDDANDGKYASVIESISADEDMSAYDKRYLIKSLIDKM